jgi:NAD+ synthase
MKKTVDAQQAITTLKRFLTGKLLQSGMDGYVVGLSGGIDSALSTTLAVEAVGAQKVLAVLMPYKTSSKASVDDALELVNKLGIEHQQVDISPMIDAYYGAIDESNYFRAGNKMARERMSIVFDIAHQKDRLVLGTGNRTEISLGYTTWYGDSACSLNPIGQLYKTEVRMLARELGVPDSIINKAPSADLWQDQTDEAEIGVTYEMIDSLLERIVDEGETSMSALENEGFSSTDISRVLSLVNRNAFKRRLPDVAPLGRAEIPENIKIQQ